LPLNLWLVLFLLLLVGHLLCLLLPLLLRLRLIFPTLSTFPTLLILSLPSARTLPTFPTFPATLFGRHWRTICAAQRGDAKA
jgi:hypothetical protein